MHALHVLSLACLMPLAGCLDPPPAADGLDGEPAPAAETLDAWGGQDRLLVAERDVATGTIREYDVLCTSGGTDFYDLPRSADVPADAVAVEFQVRSGTTTTGVQAGYERGTDITWLPIVTADERTFRVDLDAVGHDADYKYQLNTVDEDACYTGASLGDYSIHVYAVRT